jgi:hypothetical protein
VINELGAVLGRHLAAASSAIVHAGEELGRSPDVDERDTEVRALRSQIDVLGEVVALARPVADQITRHAVHAAEASSATDALMLLDTRVHDAGREVSRIDEGVSMMRAVIEGAQSRVRASAALAGSLSYAATTLPLLAGLGHEQPDVDKRTAAADTPAGSPTRGSPSDPPLLHPNIARGLRPMGDRTSIEVTVYSCPPKKVNDVLEVFEEFGLFGGQPPGFALHPNRHTSLELGRGYARSEISVGSIARRSRRPCLEPLRGRCGRTH